MTQTAFADTDVTAMVTACRTGEPEAWPRLVDRYSPLVWTIARAHRLSPADCQDAYQLTWMRAVQHLDKLRSPEQFAGWLSTAARRECLKLLERGRRYLPVGDATMLDEPALLGERPDDQLLRRDQHAEVLDAFARLPRRYQTLLGVLMADPAPSYDEASRILGVPRGSLGPQRQRALSMLRDLLTDPTT
jgi:RNA polymerase sigma factor (sigma-70 family)